MKECYKLDLVM